MTMHRSAVRAAFSLLIAAVTSLLLVSPQFAQDTAAKKFSRRANANLETRKKQIQQELKSLKLDSWAGEYYYGDG